MNEICPSKGGVYDCYKLALHGQSSSGVFRSNTHDKVEHSESLALGDSSGSQSVCVWKHIYNSFSFALPGAEESMAGLSEAEFGGRGQFYGGACLPAWGIGGKKGGVIQRFSVVCPLPWDTEERRRVSCRDEIAVLPLELKVGAQVTDKGDTFMVRKLVTPKSVSKWIKHIN